MGKILVIAEKPSVGRDIAAVLACRQKADGYLYNEQYIVSWAIGHLVSLCEPEDYGIQYKKWVMETLPIMPEQMKIKPVSKTKKQFMLLKKLMNQKDTEHIICATDSGREGELIFRYIYEAAGCKKPFSRLWISSMTQDAILEGFRAIQPGSAYENLYRSARCRSEADWLVGINGSRAYTIQYKSLLSIGRVQTPTLAMLVKRQDEIDAFEPKDYWEVQAVYEEFSGIYFLEKESETKIWDHDQAQSIGERVKGKNGIVQSVKEERKKQKSPPLYDLTELQRDCNRKFGFTAQKTLNIAQDLYEKRKVITYPRTDSRYLPGDMVPKLKRTVEKLLNQYQPFAAYLLSLPKLPLSKNIINDQKVTDHHAIIPTEKADKTASLTLDEQKVFDLVARRFLAVFYPEYIYDITKVVVDVNGDFFLSKGKKIIQLGYRELYKGEKEDVKEGEIQNLPNICQGDVLPVKDSKVFAKQTQPPKPYTEATLLSAMENAGRFVEDEALKEQLKESGLGTPATRAAIIERLIAVSYAKRQKKLILPTEKGRQLIQIVPDELKSPETTGKWEKGLTSIAKGKMDNKRFMGSIKKYVSYIVEQSQAPKDVQFAEERYQKRNSKQKSFGKCPLCGGQVRENRKAFYCVKWKSGCSFTIWKNALEPYGVAVDDKLIQKLLKDKIITDIAVVLPQTKEPCLADLVYDKQLPGGLSLKNVNRIAK